MNRFPFTRLVPKSHKALIGGTFAGFIALTSPGMAADVEFDINGTDEDLSIPLQNASSSAALAEDADAQEIIAAALSDYRTMVQVLYDAGYFAPSVSIGLDGREASHIDLLSPPQTVDTVKLSITAGKKFTFGKAEIAPLPAEANIPDTFAPNQPATTGAIQEAVTAGLSAWDRAGHPKAELENQHITANAIQARLDATIAIAPGPKLRVGTFQLNTEKSRVRPEAIRAIAGFPTGKIYNPDDISKSATRLRRTGTFSSVSLKQAETANPDGTLDFIANIEDQPPRRFTFGVELSSSEGASISTGWIHRNLFGAAERLSLNLSVDGIGEGDQDVEVSARLDRPAAFRADENLFYLASLAQLNEEHYTATQALAAIGVRRTISDRSFAEAALGFNYVTADDAFGDDREFTYLEFLLRAERDTRDVKNNPTSGYYLSADITPFVGIDGSASGVQFGLDGRAYRSLGSNDRFVLAGRAQIGSVVGPALSDVSPTLLFFSGGAGTVRGQEFQSLGVSTGSDTAGGRGFLGLSGEVRTKITGAISVVGFYDIGWIDADSFVSSNSESHAGAGFGLRYDITGVGPVRLDLALPTSGDTGDGLQFYIGIGQAF